MSGDKSSGSFNSMFKSLGEITAAVTAVLAYLQAIFKLVDTAYPDTISLLTIVFTSVMVVSWRWGKLMQKKRKTSARGTFLERLREPLTNVKPDPYVLSLTRRRVEAALLVALVLFTAGWVRVNAAGMIDELATKPGLTCSPPPGDVTGRILVADLVQSTSDSPILISDKVYNELVNHQQEGRYSVCRLAEPISLNSVAETRAQDHQADLVVWGLTDPVTYEIHLTAPTLGNPDRTLLEVASAEAASAEFQFTEPEHISFAAQFALSEILFIKGQTLEAQANLNELLQSPPEQLQPQALAEGYFLQGLFYDPGFSDNPDEEWALTAYQKAVDLDPEFYAASFNRGLILMYANRVEEAIAAFTYVIEGDGGLKASALVNRASLLDDPEARLQDLDLTVQLDAAEGYFFRGIERMNQEDYRGAIEDFTQAVRADPGGYYNYHLLGQAQLYAGETEAAKQTYVRIIPTLDEESRNQVILELREDALHTPEIAPAVDEIIASLQEANLP